MGKRSYLACFISLYARRFEVCSFDIVHAGSRLSNAFTSFLASSTKRTGRSKSQRSEGDSAYAEADVGEQILERAYRFHRKGRLYAKYA